ncbi:alpha/beta fold hydrolase [Celeribacter naphthalenivorans]|uniref:alpha/beta fold hydrolase n=1 Tax=Celeribacter naphthalenivorans TaxID=1614694 RepID=UPI001CFB7F13|nr:alpha/beta hydrolase [Celeribacter naphthalenivorans]
MKKAPFSIGKETEGNHFVGSAYWVEASDGVQIRIGKWVPTSESRGTVLICPGRTEYIEKYDQTASKLAHFGYASVVVDWRGHGLSDRIAKNPFVCHVDRFSDYQLDIHEMIKFAKSESLPEPFFMLGHSMGGLIGLRALTNGLPVAAAAFSAPMWGLNLSSVERSVVWPLTYAAKLFGNEEAFAPGGAAQQEVCYVASVPFEGNRLTSDEVMFSYMVDQAKRLPECQIGAPSMGWLLEALKEERELKKIESPNVQAVVFHGDNEVLVDTGTIRERIQNWSAGKLMVIEGARHEILSEQPDIRTLATNFMVDLFQSVAR